MTDFKEPTHGDVRPFGNHMLKIIEGQLWIEDETDTRYVVVGDPVDTRKIELHATQSRLGSKTVTLAELLSEFTQSIGRSSV